VTKEKTGDNGDEEEDYTDTHGFSAEEKASVATPLRIPQARG
jgi:hypothetical protein